MIPQLHFTDGLPVSSGGFPCLRPVWRRWPLRAAHSSSKLLFACRHLKSITSTNPLSAEHCYPQLHTGTWCVKHKLGEDWGVTVLYIPKASGRSYTTVIGNYLSHTPTDTQWTICTFETNCSRQLLPKSLHVWTAAEWAEEEDGEGGMKNREQALQ